MLIVTRRPRRVNWSSAMDVTVIVLGVQGSQVRIGVKAPKALRCIAKRSSHGSGRESRIPRDRDLESQISFVMITLSIILLLVFVPASRKPLRQIAMAAFALLGLAFLITSRSERRR